MRPNIYSIPAGEPFLETLLDALLQQRILAAYPDPDDPLALANLTILLPTRRACRVLKEMMSERVTGGIILPRIKAIGDIDEDDLLFADPDAQLEAQALHLPASIHPLRRRLVLARLILAFTQALAQAHPQEMLPSSSTDAVYLAGELARLMDMMHTQSIGFEALKAILPENLQAHWQVMLDFLHIATQTWPAFLAENGWIEPAERRRLLLEAEAATLSRLPPAPVIAAGSTGSIPATADLLRVVAHLPRGAVVLPGLDRDLDVASWQQIAADAALGAMGEPSHPQFGLRHLLNVMGVAHAHDVPVLTRAPAAALSLSSVLRAREYWLSQMMRPAATTDAWVDLPRGELGGQGVLLDQAFADVALIEARTEHEEALAIACLLRETIEVEGKTAALITPDRVLARRVAVELSRFGLEVDDSAGIPFDQSPAALLARLMAQCARDQLAPLSLLSVLKHPLLDAGLERWQVGAAVQALECLVLRGSKPQAGTQGLMAAVQLAVAHPSTRAAHPFTRAAHGVSAQDKELALALCARVQAAFAPFEALSCEDGLPLVQYVQALRQCYACLVSAEDESSLALEAFLLELEQNGSEDLPLKGHEFTEVFYGLMQGRQVRNPRANDPRIRIYGLLEARLVRHDRLVLGGLNEGVWPATTRTDPWLSRTMRRDMGLPVPEKRIGLAAHDFTQALGTQDVWMTRALRMGNAPTVASRWLQRLAAVMGAPSYQLLVQRGQKFLHLVQSLDMPLTPPQAIARPRPRPPLHLRPRRLSVTEVETLVRDPYSIYAKHILKLRDLEPVAEELDASDQGNFVHLVVHLFAQAVNKGQGCDEKSLLRIAQDEIQDLPLSPALKMFWQAKFARVVPFLVQFEQERRVQGHKITTELGGSLSFAAPYGSFELHCRADRIEQTMDGQFCLLDFKTGHTPSSLEVEVGFAPQLLLEAAMVMAGGFEAQGVSRHLQPHELAHIKLSGSAPVFKFLAVKPKEKTLEAVIAKNFAQFQALIAQFDQVDMPYRSLQHPKFRLRHGVYDHLARVLEWGQQDTDGESDA